MEFGIGIFVSGMMWQGQQHYLSGGYKKNGKNRNFFIQGVFKNSNIDANR
jgi:hypothetical protein